MLDELDMTSASACRSSSRPRGASSRCSRTPAAAAHARHVPFMEAIAPRSALAIGRASCSPRVALAYDDPLTGLANRRALDERLEPAVDRGGPSRCFCDLDGLKEINDPEGHEAGDAALRGPRRARRAADGHRRVHQPHRRRRVLPGARGRRRRRARRARRRACAALAEGAHPPTLSWGVAAPGPGTRPADCFAPPTPPSTRAKREGLRPRGRRRRRRRDRPRSLPRPPRAPRPDVQRDRARWPTGCSPSSRRCRTPSAPATSPARWPATP